MEKRPRSSWLDSAAGDLRLAIRHLRRSPGFTTSAVVTLALCIGVNTAVFSIVDRVLLRPLPYPDPERLVQVAVTLRGQGGTGVVTWQDGHALRVIRERASLLETAASGPAGGVNFAVQGKAMFVQQQPVSAGFFRVLGLRPRLGRELSADEDRPGAQTVVILGDLLWRRGFRADPAVIGRAVSLRGAPAVVVGVMSPGVETGARADLWVPLRPGEGERALYDVVARLRPGATTAAAQTQLDGLSDAALSDEIQAGVVSRLHLIGLQHARGLALRTPLLMLWAAVGAVLLIGCVNVAGLQLVRARRRNREIATRMALGASRSATVRQLLVESLLLAGAGGTAGVALGWLGVRELHALVEGAIELPAAGVDLRILAATAGLSLLSGLFFGLVPALRAGDIDLRCAMLPGDIGLRRASGGVQLWSRRLLVAGEAALCTALLITAGLLVRSLTAMSQLRPGFDPADVVTAKVSLQDARYRTSRQAARLFDAGLSRIRALPGVQAAAVTLSLPYERWLYTGFRWLDGGPPAATVQNLVLSYVSSDYFRTMRIPVLRGRAIDATDRADSPPVVVVSEAFTRKYLGSEAVIGRRVRIGGRPREVVGVVGDVQQRQGFEDRSLLAFLLPFPAAYIPAAQTEDDLLQMAHRWFSPSWVVRAKVPPAVILAGIQQAVESVDPHLPLAGFHTLEEIHSGSLRGRRVLAVLLGLFSSLALALSALGVYSLIASAVVERTREIGVRMALGATVGQAMIANAVPGVVVAFAGTAVGWILSLLAVRLLRRLVWGVSPTDLLTFTAGPLLLLAVAATASALAVMRVARQHPARILRHE